MPADQPGGVNGSRGIRRDAKISQGWQVSLGQLQYCSNTSVWAWLLSQKWRVKVIPKDTEVGHSIPDCDPNISPENEASFHTPAKQCEDRAGNHSSSPVCELVVRARTGCRGHWQRVKERKGMWMYRGCLDPELREAVSQD